jgi:phospho-N-acetylmuramoyl-pentapeptide-transferase
VLYHLLVPLAQYNIAFNLFRFQTFRAAGAVVTAFLVVFWFGLAELQAAWGGAV